MRSLRPLFAGLCLVGCAAILPALAPRAIGSRPAQAQDDPPAYLRMVGALAGDQWFDLALDGEPIFVDLEFEDVGPYEAIVPGPHVMTITPQGQDDPVVKGEVTLEPGTDYTVAVTGTAEGVEAFVIVDDNQAPAPGEAHVKMVHLAPAAPAVDVRSGEHSLFDNMAYGETSDYIRLDATTFDFSVHEAGTEPILLEGENFRVDDGHVYTLFLMQQADESLSAILATDAVPPGSGATVAFLPALRH